MSRSFEDRCEEPAGGDGSAIPSQLKVGEWVAAIGSPFGLENSVTAGIVSAKSRALPQETLVPFIQTDVAVNPGNSGGPLFNMAGEVVGINSQIFSTSGGYMGLSFAIPIDLALKVKDDLVAHGKVTRGRIGVGIQSVNAPLAESFGLDKATRRTGQQGRARFSGEQSRLEGRRRCRRVRRQAGRRCQ